jgi:predicted methyltransferase
LTSHGTLHHCPPVFSCYQTAHLLQAKRAGKVTAMCSSDLGISYVAVQLHPEYISFPNGITLSWEQIREIDADHDNCFSLSENTLQAIKAYSADNGYSFSLLPTADAPALVIAGFPMHRIKHITPLRAADYMVEAISPCHGRILDTATGLGYTAIAAARSAKQVITIEFDPISQEMAHSNPWSQELFANPVITQIIGDSALEIEKFAAKSFAAILHDPPSMALAGGLYAETFYRQALRILTAKGKMFHYIGDPDSAMGARVTNGVLQRLHAAGFRKVVRMPKEFGVVAYK